MANAHNVIIRGLNAIMQQAPYVKISTDPAYNKKDVQDLLFYVSLWVKMVQHHHSNEESFIFPEIEKFSGKPSLLDDSKHQYKRLLAYTQATNPQDYRWDGSEGMEKIIDSFSKDLIDHLHAEVEVFLAMKDLDSAGLSKTWDQGTAIAKKAANLSMLVSCSVVIPEEWIDSNNNMLIYTLTMRSTISSLSYLELPTRPTKAGMSSRHYRGLCHIL
jgi:hemerythrin-like domain-containing protein